jgi:tetratricopeptide (TPR) repeat protein
MFRKSILASFCLLAFAFAAFAQTAPVRGRVEMMDADGKKVPVVGALIEVFRTDQKGSLPSAKTDKKGYFNFAGFPAGGKFVLSMSGTGLAPELYPNVTAGREDIVILAQAGDGKKWTEAEVKEALSKPSVAGPKNQAPTTSAEEKKKQEEYNKKVAEIKEKNAKVGENNALINKVLKEGNEALNAVNYDLAISKYQEGINADSTHPGAPVLMTNKSIALRTRGVARYNAAIKGSLPLDDAKEDFASAKDSAKAAIDLLNSQTAPTEAAELKNFNDYKYNATVAYVEGMRIFVTKADQSKVDDMIAAYSSYFAIETDPLKKSKTQLVFAQALMDSQNFDMAITEFEKVLVENPNDFKALYGAGLCLVNQGYITNDKAKFQAGANYLAKFIEIAPDTDPAVSKNKAEMKETLESLKKDQNVTAQKPTKGPATTKKKP